MKKAPDFASKYSSELKDYVAFMQASGRKFGVEATILRAFDRYLCGQNLLDITEENVLSFVYLVPNLTDAQYHKRHGIIRKFSDYLNLHSAGNIISPLPKNRSKGRKIPYIYSGEEIELLLNATKTLNSRPLIKPFTYYTLFGLLASTGIRVSEALNLDISDVDLINGVLHIRCTKFKKSRLIPVHPTTIEVLKNYDALRRQHMPDQKDFAFFLSGNQTRLSYSSVNVTFRELVCECGIRNHNGIKPRIHDFRHTFAVNRLATWYDTGLDIHQMLPVLSTYMGHAHFADTAYYLEAGAELLARATLQFQRGGDRIG